MMGGELLWVYGCAALAAAAPAVLVPIGVRALGPRLARSSIVARLDRVRDDLVEALGPVPAASVIVLGGTIAVVGACWLLGEVLARLETSVDLLIFQWLSGQQDHGWVRVNELLTQLGNRPQIKVITVVAGVVFAVLWRRRRWWLPVVAMAVAFGLEKYGQQILALAVDRGHPPTSLGTYPSGGCARLIVIYGVVFLLATLTWHPPGAARLAGWTVIAVLASIEGYTRTYLLAHWFTDVIGGWLYGGGLLAVLAAGITTLTRSGGCPSSGGTGRPRASTGVAQPSPTAAGPR